MQYRSLGSTGLSVSVLGFGAAPLGGNYGPIAQETATRAVRTALELGINFFDTSPWYGNSETVLGEALAGVPREDYVLCTKLGRYCEGPMFDFSAARVQRSVDESLQKLRVDCLDIVHCHDIEFAPDLTQIVDETLPALRECVAAGKVRFVGVSGLPLGIFPAILERTALDVVLSYCHCSLNDDSLRELLPYLAQKGIGVIGASPLAMGLLSETGPQPWHPAPDALREACRAALAWCQARGISLPALALTWTLQEAGVATTLVGMGSEALVRTNAALVGVEPDPTALAGVEKILQPVHRLTWTSGNPGILQA